MTWIVKNLWLIPALPIVAAGLISVMRRGRRTAAASLAIGAMGLSFLLSLCAFAHLLKTGGSREVFNFFWFQFGDPAATGKLASVWLGWVLDPLTGVMLVMVTLVSLMIFIYSVGYMAHDENFTRFYCFLALFGGAMLGVVIANSLLLLFICWELVGLTSYLLIGFWYFKPSAAAAAKKAFITTRVGDVALLLGIVWLYARTGTLLFYDDTAGCLERLALLKLVTGAGFAASTGIGLLIFAGAAGKSGQVPLHVWLPDAMEGPTPVSALIHAATMVAAGVFLVARVYPLMAATPEYLPSPPITTAAIFSAQVMEIGTPEGQRTGSSSALAAPATQARTAAMPPPIPEAKLPPTPPASSAVLRTVTWVGAITALFAACIAVAQTDIKRILAYSTVSQLGYMMLGLGVGGVAVGMFHLITHAFFKALLFMGAGSVIHGCHDEQDIRRMGGLRKFMPVTFATYAVGMLALSGFPLLFSGFWSKDDILHSALGWSVSRWPFYMGLAGALLTAFYMTRQVCYVFFGQQRASNAGKSHGHGAGDARRVHESPWVMTVPLVVLAFFAVALGFLGTPAWPWFQSFLDGERATAELSRLGSGTVLALMAGSSAVVLTGLGLGWWLYGRKPITAADDMDALERLRPDIFGILRDKLYVDEFYEATIIAFNAWWSRGCDWLDRWVWNGCVQAVSGAVFALSWLNRLCDEYVVNGGFDRVCGRLVRGGGLLSRLQAGRVQDYLRVIGLALAVLALFLMWGCQAS